ncbi:MAG TPA: hypothetical protein VKV24_09020 [Casimicrobiaceae bacterium]|nr:hypothetical protein [Casimicrobiaceae bacterium]
MARSTLNTTGEGKGVTQKGHGTDALGPSDSSDSGSDVVGGPGLNREGGLPLEHGTTSDPDVDSAPTNAGPDLGDANLDSDSDRNGTGERAAVGRDSTEAIDETLTEHEPDEAGDFEMIDESSSEREADSIESDDNPEQEMEAAETIEKRKGLNGAERLPRRGKSLPSS